MKNLTIKIATAIAMGLLGLQIVGPAFALEMSDKAGTRPGLLRNALNKRGRAAIGMGTLKSKSGDSVPATLVVTKDGKDYIVNVDANTQLRRRFWGQASLSEFSVNDIVGVVGLWADDAHTTINAKLVRDASIQKRNGVFVGDVTSLTSTGWVMNTIHRGSQTVTVSGTTLFVNRKGEAITQADIKVGHKVRVRGMWDRVANTITEVTHVKDYSLPPRTATP